MIYKKTLLYDREAKHSFSAARKVVRQNLINNKEKQTVTVNYTHEVLEMV